MLVWSFPPDSLPPQLAVPHFDEWRIDAVESRTRIKFKSWQTFRAINHTIKRNGQALPRPKFTALAFNFIILVCISANLFTKISKAKPPLGASLTLRAFPVNNMSCNIIRVSCETLMHWISVRGSLFTLAWVIYSASMAFAAALCERVLMHALPFYATEIKYCKTYRFLCSRFWFNLSTPEVYALISFRIRFLFLRST